MCTQRIRLAGIRTPSPLTRAGADAYEWVEDWIAEHTVVNPPSLMLSMPTPWVKRTRRALHARVYAPGDACLNYDIVTAGHGWPDP